MKEIVFASHNKHKIEEIKKILGEKYLVKGLDDIGCFEEIPETGSELFENAEIKANWVKEKYSFDCFADDTGLEVEALDGAPGVYSARYAGENASYQDNCLKLLEEMNGKENRKAKFKTVICLKLNNETYFFEGIINGQILTEQRGEGGFGYDPVFLPDNYDLTLAEMTAEQKNSISHRALATKKLSEFLKTTP